MASPATQYQYVAGIDFDSKNLKVGKDQPLPDRWQHTELIRQLRQKYGEGSVLRRVVNFQRGQETREQEPQKVSSPSQKPKGK